ncbi:MAG: hypothetical protein IJN00_07550 [Clostridia bacterium]|nr:hypothetical protein [Clostridia bacterium]
MQEKARFERICRQGKAEKGRRPCELQGQKKGAIIFDAGGHPVSCKNVRKKPYES